MGATILILALVRLAWRLLHPPPPFPTELPRWERVASVWAHRAFYLLLILLPLTGLMAVSGGAEADGRTSTPLLGGIPLPDRKSTRLNSSHSCATRMPSSA